MRMKVTPETMLAGYCHSLIVAAAIDSTTVTVKSSETAYQFDDLSRVFFKISKPFGFECRCTEAECRVSNSIHGWEVIIAND